MIYLIVSIISFLEFALVFQLARSVGVKVTLAHVVGCVIFGGLVVVGVFGLFLL